jgi:hypothetical protein
MSEQEQQCYICNHQHIWGDNIVQHYIENHYEEVVKWYLNKDKIQSNRGSVIETILNVGSGFFVAFALNLYFLPVFASEIADYNPYIALVIGLTYTAVSFVRSLTFRKIFNKVTGKRKWL